MKHIFQKFDIFVLDKTWNVHQSEVVKLKSFRIEIKYRWCRKWGLRNSYDEIIFVFKNDMTSFSNLLVLKCQLILFYQINFPFRNFCKTWMKPFNRQNLETNVIQIWLHKLSSISFQCYWSYERNKTFTKKS